jgi:hypothetical protein
LTCQAVARGMMARRQGRIVTIGSIAAFNGRTNASIYAVSKAGVTHYTRCLADQLRAYDITVNCIAPGDTRTGRFMGTRAVDPSRMVETGTLDRIATVDEVARVVEVFAGPLGAFVSGQVLRVDGGGQCWPKVEVRLVVRSDRNVYTSDDRRTSRIGCEIEKAKMKHSLTQNLAALALFLFPAAASAAPATVTGPTALALAAVVAQHSSLPAYDKRVMSRLFAGDTIFFISAKTRVSVIANTIVCRTSNVDIAARSCDLTFPNSKKTVKGREANELYATAASAGVAAEGAAGSNIESFSKLTCTIDPKEIRQKAGGGATCSFETGK